MAAVEISKIQHQLQEKNIKLIGIGVERLGLDDFIRGGFFTGDLYIDESKKSYVAMGFKQMSYSELLGPAFFSPSAREAITKSFSQGLGGNMWGDGWQKGGCMVVGVRGTPLYYYYLQEEAPKHPENDDILKALQI